LGAKDFEKSGDGVIKQMGPKDGDFEDSDEEELGDEDDFKVHEENEDKNEWKK
jgi:hypothetical protein